MKRGEDLCEHVWKNPSTMQYNCIWYSTVQNLANKQKHLLLESKKKTYT